MSQPRRITIKLWFASTSSTCFLQVNTSQPRDSILLSAMKDPCCWDSHRRDGYLEAQSVRPCTGWAAGGRGFKPGVLLG